GAERRRQLLQAREAALVHPAIVGVDDEVGPRQAPHLRQHARRVREAGMVERLDDAVESVDDLALAPPGGERRRRDGGGRHRGGLDGDERYEDLILYGPAHRDVAPRRRSSLSPESRTAIHETLRGTWLTRAGRAPGGVRPTTAKFSPMPAKESPLPVRSAS